MGRFFTQLKSKLIEWAVLAGIPGLLVIMCQLYHGNMELARLVASEAKTQERLRAVELAIAGGKGIAKHQQPEEPIVKLN